MNKTVLIIIVLIGLVVVGAAGWYLASPLFIDDVVDEAFPPQIPSAAEMANMPEERVKELEAEARQVAANMPDKVMDDPMPQADAPAVVLQGQFQDADSFHRGSGTATIYRLPEGGHILRFEDFSATNGPDLHVLLVAHPAPTGRDEIMQDYLDLGSLKGNIGNQNYEIPSGTDITKYQSVVIYCMPFHVIFATASLQ